MAKHCVICERGEPCYPPHEREILMQIDAWLAAMPSEYKHGDPVHDPQTGILAGLRRGDWRMAVPPSSEEQNK